MTDSIGGLVSFLGAPETGADIAGLGFAPIPAFGGALSDIGGAIGTAATDVGQALGFGGGGYTAPSFGGDITAATGISPATVSGPISAGAGPGMSAISAAPSFDAASAADNFYLSSSAPAPAAIGADIGGAAGFAGANASAFGPGSFSPGYATGAMPAASGGANFIPSVDPVTGLSVSPSGGVSIAGGGQGIGGAASNLTTGQQFLQSPSLENLGKMALANPGILLGGGLLGLNALKSQKIPGLAPIQQQAGQLGAAGTQLSQPLLTGKLPAGAQAAVDEAVRSNQANVRSQFANMGLSGSTMESTALQEAALRGQELTFQIAQSMAQLGLQDTALSSDLLKTIMQAQLQNDNALSQSIANFATALAGGGPSVKLSLA